MCEVIGLRVTNLVGDVVTYRCASVKELRLKLATQYDVLCPCICLYTQPDNEVIGDAHDVAAPGTTQQYDLFMVNNACNEQWLKEEVATWSAEQWIRSLEPHVQQGAGDMSIIHRATAMDAGFEDKMPELLHAAAASGNLDALHLLVCAGVNVDAKDNMGRTPLNLAASFDKTDAVRALLHAGANPSLEDTWRTHPIHHTARNGNVLSNRSPSGRRCGRICERP